MILIVVAGAFGAATLLSQALLGRSKVQIRVGTLAAVHLAIAVPVLALLRAWLQAGLAAPMLFWAGAGLSWFVVRSHLENSILLAMLDDLEEGGVDPAELLRLYRDRHGFAARLEELKAAGLVGEAAGQRFVTRKGRLVLAFFGWLGGEAA